MTSNLAIGTQHVDVVFDAFVRGSHVSAYGHLAWVICDHDQPEAFQLIHGLQACYWDAKCTPVRVLQFRQTRRASHVGETVALMYDRVAYISKSFLAADRLAAEAEKTQFTATTMSHRDFKVLEEFGPVYAVKAKLLAQLRWVGAPWHALPVHQESGKHPE